MPLPSNLLHLVYLLLLIFCEEPAEDDQLFQHRHVHLVLLVQCIRQDVLRRLSSYELLLVLAAALHSNPHEHWESFPYSCDEAAWQIRDCGCEAVEHAVDHVDGWREGVLGFHGGERVQLCTRQDADVLCAPVELHCFCCRWQQIQKCCL